MRSSLSAILCLLTVTTWAPIASRADDVAVEADERFTQATDRTFKAFDQQVERTWRQPFFFLRLADTQYGMFNGNEGFAQEAALAQRAVEQINRLRPRFVIDLTNATPDHARYRVQVAQSLQGFSQVDAEIPLGYGYCNCFITDR